MLGEVQGSSGTVAEHDFGADAAGVDAAGVDGDLGMRVSATSDMSSLSGSVRLSNCSGNASATRASRGSIRMPPMSCHGDSAGVGADVDAGGAERARGGVLCSSSRSARSSRASRSRSRNHAVAGRILGFGNRIPEIVGFYDSPECGRWEFMSSCSNDSIRRKAAWSL